MKLLFIVNTAEFFLSHRLPIALSAQKSGFTVHVATGFGGSIEIISEFGFTHHLLPISRSGKNPVYEIRTIWSIFLLIRNIKPDILHLVTIKPVVYGGWIAKILGVPSVVAAISGLGSIFVANKNPILRRHVEILYRLALNHKNIKVIFQNTEDQSILLNIGSVSHNNALIINGSGVDLSDYSFVPETENIPVVTFASRLIKDKGIVDFVNAARILKAKGKLIKFIVAGNIDRSNPSSVKEYEVNEWVNEGTIEYIGFKKDINHLFTNTNIVVLPSFYGEGLPKVLIEAAACGRAVITTDHPGCRDAIINEETGLLVPIQDPESLANAIQDLIENPSKRKKMGLAGRRLAEEKFSIEKVVNAHMDIYQKLLKVKFS